MKKFLPVPISMPSDMVDQVNERAAALGLSRSAYLQQLIRSDLGMQTFRSSIGAADSSRSDNSALSKARKKR